MGKLGKRTVQLASIVLLSSSLHAQAAKEVLISATFPIDYSVNGVNLYSIEMKEYILNKLKVITHRLNELDINLIFRQDLEFLNEAQERVKFNFRHTKSMKGSLTFNQNSICIFSNLNEIDSCISKHLSLAKK